MSSPVKDPVSDPRTTCAHCRDLRHLPEVAHDLSRCPVCTPIVYQHCAGCGGTGWVRSADVAPIRRTLR